MAHTEAHVHTTATHTNPYPDSSDPYGPGPGAHDPGRYAACPVDVSHANRDLHALESVNRVARPDHRPVDSGLGTSARGSRADRGQGDPPEEGEVSDLYLPVTPKSERRLHLGSTLPDAIEQIRAERDILRRRVEERAHDCANVEAERDRLREENEQLKQMLVSASQAELTPGVPFSAPGVPSSREPLYVYRPMTQAEVEAQVEKNRWGTDE